MSALRRRRSLRQSSPSNPPPKSVTSSNASGTIQYFNLYREPFNLGRHGSARAASKESSTSASPSPRITSMGRPSGLSVSCPSTALTHTLDGFSMLYSRCFGSPDVQLMTADCWSGCAAKQHGYSTRRSQHYVAGALHVALI